MYQRANNSDKDYEEAIHLDSFTNKLLLFYPWIMIVWATISNCLSFAVLTRPKLKKSSTFFYLSCLCISDLIQVYTFCVNFIFYYSFDVNLQLKNAVYCKIFSFLIYFLPQYSAWTCAAVSIDRVVGVIFSVRGKYALAARRWNTPESAMKVMTIIFFVLLLINGWLIFFPKPEIGESPNEIIEVNIVYCSLEFGDYNQYLNQYWTVIDLSMNVLIPFAIMIICSVIIVIGIVNSTKNLQIRKSFKSKSKKKNRNDKNTLESPLTLPTSVPSQKSLEEYPNLDQADRAVTNSVCLNKNVQNPCLELNKTIKEPSGQTSVVKRVSATFVMAVSSKARNVSVMLTVNNAVFILLTLPIVVCLFEISSLGGFQAFTFLKKAKVNLVKVVCIILMNTNCTINIFVYSIMASEFRRHLFNILRKMFCSKIITFNSSQAKPSSKTKSFLRRSTLIITNGEKCDDMGIQLSET